MRSAYTKTLTKKLKLAPHKFRFPKAKDFMPDKRLTNDWLASYLELTANLEAPESIHLWTALSLISMAVRRNVYLEMEYGRIYPNLYTIIVAESAKVRKSAAMDIGRELLLEAIPDIRIMRDSMTAQGLIKSLNHRTQVIKGDKIEEELRSDVAIFADEVANLFGYERTRAAQMVIFLTRAYTCPGIYDHTTVRDSTVRLHNLYPVLLGGTDPRNLKVFPEDAVGGLTGRLIWVIESARRANNPGWKKPSTASLQHQLLREYLIHDLKRIAALRGEITVTPEAMEMYDQWYELLSTKNTHDVTTDAFYHRCHTTALRLLILLALASGDEMQATAKHMRGAIALIEAQLPEVKRVDMWKGSSQHEQHRAKCIHYLQQCPKNIATVPRLLKYMGMLSEEFVKMIETLKQDGTIEAGPRLGNVYTIQLTAQGRGVEVIVDVEGT